MVNYVLLLLEIKKLDLFWKKKKKKKKKKKYLLIKFIYKIYI